MSPSRPGFIPNHNQPVLALKRYPSIGYCLANDFYVPVDGCPEEKILTYKVKCPYVFGDDEIHEFVTYWNIHGTRTECHLIEHEGKQITIRQTDKSKQARQGNNKATRSI